MKFSYTFYNFLIHLSLYNSIAKCTIYVHPVRDICEGDVRDGQTFKWLFIDQVADDELCIIEPRTFLFFLSFSSNISRVSEKDRAH